MYYYKLYNRKQKIIFKKYHQTDICLETISENYICEKHGILKKRGVNTPPNII